MPRPEDRWGDIVSPLMVSDNLDWIVCCISDTTTALLRTSGEKKAKAKRAHVRSKDSVIPSAKEGDVRCFLIQLGQKKAFLLATYWIESRELQLLVKKTFIIFFSLLGIM